MEFLGIGAPELLFIILIALILLGPKDMEKTGRTIGKWLNNLVRSDGWRVFQRTSRELRNLPTNLMRQANLEVMEAERELRNQIEPRPAAGGPPPAAASPVPAASKTEPEAAPRPDPDNSPADREESNE
jgi:sec-independent protein translocase protein TatB